MTLNSADNMLAFLGEDESLFRTAEAAVHSLGREIQLAKTKIAINRLLDTQAISTLIVDLNLKNEDGQMLLNQIKRERPQLRLVALTSYKYRGHSIADTLAHNCYCMARGISGTYTVEQFKQAIERVEAQTSARFKRSLIAVVCLISILSFAAASYSPYGRFLGAFWVVILLFEFGHFLVHSRKQRA